MLKLNQRHLRTREGSKWLGIALEEAALAATRSKGTYSKGTYLQAQYQAEEAGASAAATTSNAATRTRQPVAGR